MYQFTQTIILNSLLDVTTGLDKIVEKTIDGNPALDIKRVNVFKKANVSKIFKRAASEPVKGSVTFDLTGTYTAGDIYRLKLYIRLSGSANSYYSNSLVFKGKPLMYEFKVQPNKTSANEVALEAKRVVDKIQTLYGDKWIKARVKDSLLTIEGMDEYQLFTEATIQKLEVPVLGSGIVSYNPEEFIDKIAGVIIPCKEGFGTYTTIIKDLRLPTMEARRFEAVNQEELPIPGVKYNQYTLYYKVDRGLFGGAAIGQQVTSVTTHVFYVAENLVTEFEAFLTKLGTIKTIEQPIAIQSGVSDVTILKAGETKSVTPVLKDVVAGVTTDTTIKWVDAVVNVDWLTVKPSASKVDLIAPDNATGKDRIARVEIKVVNSAGASISQVIKVTQSKS